MSTLGYSALEVSFDEKTGVVVSDGDAVRLPAIPPEELDATIAAARSTLSELHRAAMPPATRRALASVLRYWSLWYRATFGDILPLLRQPREPVPGDAVLVFIAHHSASRKKDAGGERVCSGMPHWVRERLRALRQGEQTADVGRRQISRRATASRVAIEDDVVALKTLQQRVSLLGTLHENFGLKRPQVADGRIRAAIVLAGKASRNQSLPTLPLSKKALTDVELRLLLQSIPTQASGLWLDIRDRALLMTSFSGGGRRRSEVMQMQMSHLSLANFTLKDGRVAPGFAWNLYRLKGRVSDRLDKPLLTIPLVGASAAALRDWLSTLRAAGFEEGSVWRHVYTTRAPVPEKRFQRIGALLKDEALADVVKARMRPALKTHWTGQGYVGAELDDRVENALSRYAAHSLRSGYITTQLQNDVDMLSIMKMTGHESVSSFKIYDQRRVEDNPTLGVLLDSGL